jgi:2-C-methyl-D-erythritol 4-phosphate cytidylyltransferase
VSTAAIIVAGGEGIRMKAGGNKVFLDVGGRSMLERSLELFEASPFVDEIVVVTRSSDIQRCEALASRFHKLAAIVAGGDLRHRSEFAGVKALAGKIDAQQIDVVLVHDAARPFATDDLVDRLIHERNGSIGCIPGLPLPSTAVEVKNGWISAYPYNLWAVQTPQVFEATWLLEAHNKAARQGFVGTDTASVVEWAGGDVRVIQGEDDNIKITSPADLEVARRIAATR